MKRAALPGFGLIALLLLLAQAPRAAAATSGVRDEAKFFSPDAISRAEGTLRQISQKHQKDVLVETFPSIPQDLQAKFQQEGKAQFFEGWANQLAHQSAVDGVLILITRSPGHIQVWDGNKTSQRLFTQADRTRLSNGILATAFRNKQFDQGLEQAVQFIQQQMDAHGAAQGQTSANSAAAPPPPANYPGSTPGSGSSSHWGLGGIACIVIGVIILIMLARAVVGRSLGGGRRGGYYPPGGPGYPPQGGPGYPPGAGGYGYGGGGGGGFGRGLLGGLLGGALGGYAGEKWAERGQQQGGGYAPPPQQGGADAGGIDTSGTSSGADFDSGGGDSGGGGADFSGGGGGADFGGGGGADFGGGGGDFGGGGGDAGSSGGSDF
jgi:uncharacterized membrane protein YgcG